MKITKSYTVRLGGNIGKAEYIRQQLQLVKKVSEYAYSLGKDMWSDMTPLYHACRREVPTLNSMILQAFLRQHFVNVNWKLKPKRYPKESLPINYHSSRITDNKLSNYWVHFHRKNFPLFGKILQEKFKSPEEIKQIEITERKGKLYCKLSVVTTIPDRTVSDEIPKAVGLDINSKRIVLGNNDFFHLKKHHHRKIEHKKNKQKQRSIENYTKDVVHKMTTEVANNLQTDGMEVLILEDLKHLRKSASKKLGTSKGKNINYIVNTLPYAMFRKFLEYKCLDRGIDVVYVNPAYTSKMCSNCGSYNTTRKQTSFRCAACNYSLDADLNGSRNIQERYYLPEWATSESSPLSDL